MLRLLDAEQVVGQHPGRRPSAEGDGLFDLPMPYVAACYQRRATAMLHAVRP